MGTDLGLQPRELRRENRQERNLLLLFRLLLERSGRMACLTRQPRAQSTKLTLIPFDCHDVGTDSGQSKNLRAGAGTNDRRMTTSLAHDSAQPRGNIGVLLSGVDLVFCAGVLQLRSDLVLEDDVVKVRRHADLPHL